MNFKTLGRGDMPPECDYEPYSINGRQRIYEAYERAMKKNISVKEVLYVCEIDEQDLIDIISEQKLKIEIEKMLVAFLKVCVLAKVKLLKDDIEVIVLSTGSHYYPTKLLKGLMAVYIFTDKEGKICYKVGKAGTNSNSRLQNHHYNPKSSKSNLANSILNDEQFKNNEEVKENVGEWIKRNTIRTNIFLPAYRGIFTLNLLEAFFQNRLEPIYEGHESQRKK